MCMHHRNHENKWSRSQHDVIIPEGSIDNINWAGACSDLVVVWQAAIVCQGVPELPNHKGGLSCPDIVPHVAAVEASHIVQPAQR